MKLCLAYISKIDAHQYQLNRSDKIYTSFLYIVASSDSNANPIDLTTLTSLLAVSGLSWYSSSL